MNREKYLANTMVITLKEILNGSKPILYLSHDKEDGMWQFLDGSVELDPVDARIISFEEVLKIDSSLRVLIDLPKGWLAERANPNVNWKKSKRV